MSTPNYKSPGIIRSALHFVSSTPLLFSALLGGRGNEAPNSARSTGNDNINRHVQFNDDDSLNTTREYEKYLTADDIFDPSFEGIAKAEQDISEASASVEEISRHSQPSLQTGVSKGFAAGHKRIRADNGDVLEESGDGSEATLSTSITSTGSNSPAFSSSKSKRSKVSMQNDDVYVNDSGAVSVAITKNVSESTTPSGGSRLKVSTPIASFPNQFVDEPRASVAVPSSSGVINAPSTPSNLASTDLGAAIRSKMGVSNSYDFGTAPRSTSADPKFVEDAEKMRIIIKYLRHFVPKSPSLSRGRLVTRSMPISRATPLDDSAFWTVQPKSSASTSSSNLDTLNSSVLSSNNYNISDMMSKSDQVSNFQVGRAPPPSTGRRTSLLSSTPYMRRRSVGISASAYGLGTPLQTNSTDLTDSLAPGTSSFSASLVAGTPSSHGVGLASRRSSLTGTFGLSSRAVSSAVTGKTEVPPSQSSQSGDKEKPSKPNVLTNTDAIAAAVNAATMSSGSGSASAEEIASKILEALGFAGILPLASKATSSESPTNAAPVASSGATVADNSSKTPSTAPALEEEDVECRAARRIAEIEAKEKEEAQKKSRPTSDSNALFSFIAPPSPTEDKEQSSITTPKTREKRKEREDDGFTVNSKSSKFSFSSKKPARPESAANSPEKQVDSTTSSKSTGAAEEKKKSSTTLYGFDMKSYTPVESSSTKAVTSSSPLKSPPVPTFNFGPSSAETTKVNSSVVASTSSPPSAPTPAPAPTPAAPSFSFGNAVEPTAAPISAPVEEKGASPLDASAKETNKESTSVDLTEASDSAPKKVAFSFPDPIVKEHIDDDILQDILRNARASPFVF